MARERRRLQERVGESGSVRTRGDGYGGTLFTVRCKVCWQRPPTGKFIGARPVVAGATSDDAWEAWQLHARSHPAEVGDEE
jgi:hypothetical protein